MHHETPEVNKSKKINTSNEKVFPEGPVTALQPFTLKSLACNSQNTDRKVVNTSQERDSYHRDKGLDPEVIYTVPIKPNKYKEHHDHVTDLDASIKSISQSSETLVSESTRQELCHSEGDIKKALQSEHHDLSSVTKSLRKSSSLNRLNLDTQTSDDKQDLEQYSYYYDKNKHLSGTDAYIYMVPDDPRPDERNGSDDNVFVPTRRATYNLENESDDECQNRNRRRSYNIAIMDDARSSENLTPGDNVEDVFSPDGNTGVDGNDSTQDENENKRYVSSSYWIIDQKDSLHGDHNSMTNGDIGHENHSYEMDNFSTDAYNGSNSSNGDTVISNNFNGQNDVEKSFKGKDINGIGNKEETLNTNGSQDVVAFF
jgi:hypothetical protein